MLSICSNFKRSLLISFAYLVGSLLLAGCGASGAPTSTATPTSNTTTTTPSGSITLVFRDPTTGATTTSAPATVTATILDSNGSPVANTVVTFTTTDPTLLTLNPSSGTALTNASGVASISVTPTGTLGGAATLSASAQIGNAAVTASRGISLNGQVVTITTPVFGTNPLSAYGTTSVSVTVSPAPSPLTVSFTSPCASSGKAVLSTNIATVNGVATASYLDSGCAGTDTITASASGMASSQADLVVTPPIVGSLQFVSATPSIISLKGTGGTETSQVVFKVTDAGGNGIGGKLVSFDLSTVSGGITLTPAPIPPATQPTAVSDANGLVTITVNAGTFSTAVRVTASTTEPTSGTILQSQSSGLTITTGVPDQDSFSLAATIEQIEGWDFDGMTTVLTARLSDHFNNPAPDGTAVNFTTEGGQIIGSCFTAAGACTSTLTSSQPRPANGRVSVIAYAVGEESFVDLNGNGVADKSPVNELIDTNSFSSDMAEAWLDADENGAFTGALNEPFVDFNNNGTYDAADGLFNGVLCSTISSAGTCSLNKTISVRQSHVIIFASSSPSPLALFSWNPVTSAFDIPATSIRLPSCSTTPTDVSMPIVEYAVRIVDINGNAMPTGTTIALSTDNGKLFTTASKVVPNNPGCSSAFLNCPASVGTADFELHRISMQSDATYATATATCTNGSPSGALTVTVTSPTGLITSTMIPVVD